MTTGYSARLDRIVEHLRVKGLRSADEVHAYFSELNITRDAIYKSLRGLMRANRIHCVKLPRNGKTGSPPIYYAYGAAPRSGAANKNLKRDGDFVGPVWRSAKEWRHQPMIDPLALPMEFFRRSA